MQQIKCPNCGEVFQVDESGYQRIAQQVRDKEFQKELDRRERELSEKKAQEQEVIRLQQAQKHERALSEREGELARKEQAISDLRAKLEGAQTEKELAVAEAVGRKERELSEKQTEIASLQGELKRCQTQSHLQEEALKDQYEERLRRKDEQNESDLQVLRLRQEQELAELRAKLENAEAEQRLAVAEAVRQKDREISEKQTEIANLQGELQHRQSQSQLREEALKDQYEEQLRRREEQRDGALEVIRLQQAQELAALQAKLEHTQTEKQLAVAEAVGQKDREIFRKQTEIADLESRLELQQTESQLTVKSLRDQYEDRLKLKDEQIEYYKDFKAKQSTKMVGESLEQHCENSFNAIRMTAFPRAYFEKDNDARSGSKGDFIFRERAEDGTEFISIMFEMKNEMETTATKHKNEHFFKELDKDRREKGCEYAVLVSLLEGDSEYYNAGIVDVSYRYPKMYVIRPQFFIPLITLLRNAALNSLQYQQQLALVRSQQVDISNFEANMQEFKDKFGRNYRIASERFKTAIEEIDKTIEHLEKTKKALLSSENNLRLANEKAEDLSIKRLTKNAPSVRQMFEELPPYTELAGGS